MSDFGFSSSSSSSSSSGMNGAQRAELMDQVKSQLLVATLQELLSVRNRAVWWVRFKFTLHVLYGTAPYFTLMLHCKVIVTMSFSLKVYFIILGLSRAFLCFKGAFSDCH